MKRITISLLFLLALSFCKAQGYRIYKAHAFFTVSMPGTIMVDDKGNPVDPVPIIERVIYLECNYKGKPKIDSVLYNGLLFTATMEDRELTGFTIGAKKESGAPVRFIPKKGNHIWKIFLNPADGKPLLHEDLKSIVIRGKLDKYRFRYFLFSETELRGYDRP